MNHANKTPEQIAAHNARVTPIIEKHLEGTGFTFGYIGNVWPWGDDRSWQIFRPHPGRVGTWEDRIGTPRDTDNRYRLVATSAAIRAGFDEALK